MKRIYNNHCGIALCAGVLMLAAGCSEENLGGMSAPDTRQAINLAGSYPSASRVSDNSFADGDHMGIYVVDYVNESTPGHLSDAKLRADNVKFTFDEAAGKWNGATTLYWRDKTTKIDIYGYYPFNAELEDPTAYHFKIQHHQNTSATASSPGGYEASDLLWTKGAGISPTEGVIQLTYTHALAGITVRLVAGEGFADGEFPQLTKLVWIDNVVNEAIVNFETQTVAPNGNETSKVMPLEYNGEYRAIVVPQTVAAGKTVVGMTIDGVDYRLNKSESLTYNSGKMHTFTINVDKRADLGTYKLTLVDEAITAWVDDPEFHDGIVRQYIVVECPHPGQLKDVIQEKGLEPGNIQALKINGTLNFADLTFIREEMKIISSLNLQNVIIDDEDDEKDNTIGNLSELRYLHRVILPKTLKKIRGEAFFLAPIMDVLEVPEGVVEIEDAAFFNGFGHIGIVLKGDITLSGLKLPTTLKKLGNAVFHGYTILGDFILPDGLEYIGTQCFMGADLKGQLILPKSIKHIGGNAFYGRFTGGLTVPQGLTMEEWAFSGCKFTGTLELPEGLEKIPAHAFDGTEFRNELVIPSTVKEIGTCAFRWNMFNKIIFHDDVTYIGEFAFDGNRLTGALVIPKKVQTINRGAFAGCSLITSLELPEDIAYIGENAFDGCERLTSIIIKAETPPLITSTSFLGVDLSSCVVEVPANAVDAYKSDKRWREFKRITPYRNFVCRPQNVCALNKQRTQTMTLNADGPWTVASTPDWCRISPTSGTGKTSLTLTIDRLAKGAEPRTGNIVFDLTGKNVQTNLEVVQYDYEYEEDYMRTLQTHTKGNGIPVYFIGDGWNAANIASGAYMKQCEENMEYFFGLAPYNRLREYFDVYAGVALSQEEGVNTIYTYRNTRFSTIYTAGVASASCSGVGSQLLPDQDLIFNYLQREVDGTTVSDDNLRRGLVVVVPNVTDYPGATYYIGDRTISICPPSTNPYPNDSRGIIQHEACGHGFGKLGDELITKNAFASTGVKRQIDEMHERGWFMNLASSGNMNTVPWADLIFDPRYSDYVDVFEGGYGYTRGIFRSESNSCMNFGIPYFSAVSRRDITKRIFETAMEPFNLEEFYRNDTNAFGNSGLDSRAATEELAPMPDHCAPTLTTSAELNGILKTLRKKQSANK